MRFLQLLNAGLAALRLWRAVKPRVEPAVAARREAAEKKHAAGLKRKAKKARAKAKAKKKVKKK